MNNEVMGHHPEEIHREFMVNDLKRWKEEIEIINVEMIFFRNLINSHLQELTTWSATDYRNLLNGISEVKKSNKLYQKQFQSFSNNLEGMRECDNLECETYFLNDHARFKSDIESHFSQYKAFKKRMFTFLRTKYNY